MASYPFDKDMIGGAGGVAAVAIALGLLMASNVKYRTFKDLRPSKKSITIAFVVLLCLAAVAQQVKPTVALASFFMGYISLGLLEEVIFFRSRRRARIEALEEEEEEELDIDHDQDLDDDELEESPV